MWKFILAYLLIYSSIHAVFFHRTRVLLPQKTWAVLLMVVFLALMVLSPIFTRIMEVKGHDAMARGVAFVAYYWMGFLFLVFCGGLFLYFLEFIAGVIRILTPVKLSFSSGKLPVLILLGICGAVMVYGYIEALNLKVEHVVVETKKLPDAVQSFRIVQISDVHLGIINRDRVLKHIMDEVRNLNPDMLVATGDLVDGSMHNLMHLADHMKSIDPPYGKFAVTGNHEYYAGLDHAIEFMEEGGFVVLRGEVRTVGGVINVAGIDDGGRATKVDDGDTLSNISNSLFTLYLKHRPQISKQTIGLFDLQLSGHTHNGQIWPFNILVKLAFDKIEGLYQLENGSKLYVSRGTGTWGPPIRVLSPPEITLLTLTRKLPENVF